MEARETALAPAEYTLPSSRYASEDIMFCIDIDNECLKEMKVSSGQVFTRLDTIKQAILLFMHAKLSINSDHRFAFCAIGKSTYWLRKEFSNTLDSALAAFRGIAEHYSSDEADLTQLFREAAHEAKKSRAQDRILRLVLLYCRSSVAPHHQWPVTQKLFTLDVMYLHDKPGPKNCAQKVYDALVDTLEQVSEYEGYIFETQGLPRILFRYMCVLLSHPRQRCLQDDIEIPKSLRKKTAAVEKNTAGETVSVSSQELRGVEIEQVHIRNEVDHEWPQAERSEAEAELEMAKVEAAKEADHERPQVELSGVEAELEIAKAEAANEADHERPQVELSGAEAELEMAKVEASKEADHELQVELSEAEAEMAKVEAAKEADHELQVELSEAEAELEMAKVEAAKEADHERPQVELSGGRSGARDGQGRGC